MGIGQTISVAVDSDECTRGCRLLQSTLRNQPAERNFYAPVSAQIAVAARERNQALRGRLLRDWVRALEPRRAALVEVCRHVRRLGALAREPEHRCAVRIECGAARVLKRPVREGRLRAVRDVPVEGHAEQELPCGEARGGPLRDRGLGIVVRLRGRPAEVAEGRVRAGRGGGLEDVVVPVEWSRSDSARQMRGGRCTYMMFA